MKTNDEIPAIDEESSRKQEQSGLCQKQEEDIRKLEGHLIFKAFHRLNRTIFLYLLKNCNIIFPQNLVELLNI